MTSPYLFLHPDLVFVFIFGDQFAFDGLGSGQSDLQVSLDGHPLPLRHLAVLGVLPNLLQEDAGKNQSVPRHAVIRGGKWRSWLFIAEPWSK